jgi:transposase
VLTEAHDDEPIVERVAALDVGKAELMCCVRIADHEAAEHLSPGPGGTLLRPPSVHDGRDDSIVTLEDQVV